MKIKDLVLVKENKDVVPVMMSAAEINALADDILSWILNNVSSYDQLKMVKLVNQATTSPWTLGAFTGWLDQWADDMRSRSRLYRWGRKQMVRALGEKLSKIVFQKWMNSR
jgi:hypothetical protein